jgi:2-iminoacetate synthase ThiH
MKELISKLECTHDLTDAELLRLLDCTDPEALAFLAERARAVRATGHCDGIAVVSAICAAEDPEQAARELA